MRISDWSSDVCSSDLGKARILADRPGAARIHGCAHPARKRRKAGEPRVRFGHVRRRVERLHRDAFRRLPGQVLALDLLVGQRLPIANGLVGHQWLPSPLGVSISSTSTPRSEEHTSELQSLMRISYAVFCLKKQNAT